MPVAGRETQDAPLWWTALQTASGRVRQTAARSALSAGASAALSLSHLPAHLSGLSARCQCGTAIEQPESAERPAVRPGLELPGRERLAGGARATYEQKHRLQQCPSGRGARD